MDPHRKPGGEGGINVPSHPIASHARPVEEYFDVFYGIEPLAWATCGFAIVYYGALLKNSAQTLRSPFSIRHSRAGLARKRGNWLVVKFRRETRNQESLQETIAKVPTQIRGFLLNFL